MPHPDWKSLPLDPAAIATASSQNLRYRLVDASDPADFHPYWSAVGRGFLGPESTDEQLEGGRDAVGFRRLTGVYDRSEPVATVNSWILPLTLPGRREIPMWAISGVSVAPTHRRRGLARTMLEAELRTAAAAGVAIAGLTVSEATIYGRFGFAPATFATDWTLDTARTAWVGPRPAGRLEFVTRTQARDELGALHERVRATRPGEVQPWPGLWSRTTGTLAGQENVRSLRAVRYTDESGLTRGILVYRLTEDEKDFSRHTLIVQYLLADGDDAYAALWRFALEHDLVSTVTAELRSVDEPLRWMIADQRGAILTTSEHGWLRILDVPTVLRARAYAAPAALIVRVLDDLGFAGGTWRIDVDGAGEAEVSATHAAADLTLSVNDLSAVLLGGVRAATLHAAGWIQGDRDAASALDRSFASADTPYLSVWY